MISSNRMQYRLSVLSNIDFKLATINYLLCTQQYLQSFSDYRVPAYVTKYKIVSNAIEGRAFS